MPHPAPIRTILLRPAHVRATTPRTRPLLLCLQRLLNTAYTAAYCAVPDYFGTEHIRLAHAEQFASIIEPDGFTLVLLRVESADETGVSCGAIVATGSVRRFREADLARYGVWRGGVPAAGTDGAAAEGHGVQGREGRAPVVAMEITALAVAPAYQGCGFGAQVLTAVEGLVRRFGVDGPRDLLCVGEEPPLLEGRVLPSEACALEGPVVGIDVDRLGELFSQGAGEAGAGMDRSGVGEAEGVGEGLSPTRLKLVLVGIRELGIVDYYERRGFESVATGVLPVGTWDCRKECELVYMEKEVHPLKI